MATVVDTVMGLLCQQNTVSQCQQFVSSYPDMAQQLVWLIFFPAVFLIIFINIIAAGVLKEKTKYKTLLAVAIFVFIIVQGWYYWFLNVSKFWFISIIVLGGVYAFIHKMGSADKGGGAAREMAAGGGGNWLKDVLVGDRELNPVEIARNRKYMLDKIKELEMKIREQEDLKKMAGGERSKSVYDEQIARLRQELQDIKNLLKSGKRMNKAA